VLWESEHVRAIPDLYPVVPGHLLLISQEHLPAYGAASPEVLADLDVQARVALAFVHDAYGIEPLLWENGGALQTVFHAHLHVMPVDLPGLVDEVIRSEHMIEIPGLGQVAEYWQQHGPYHYLEFQGHRRLTEGQGQANWEFRRQVAVAAGLRLIDGRWQRATTGDDVAELGRRWEAYRPGPGV